MTIKLSEKTIKALGQVITGDGRKSRYRSGPELVTYFNEFGLNNTYGEGFPSRWFYAEDCIKQLNDTDVIKNIIEESVDPREYLNTEFDVEEVVIHLNEYLQYENLKLYKSGLTYALGSVAGQYVGILADTTSRDPLSNEFIQGQIQKCRDKITSGDFDGAITNARTLVEEVLLELEARLEGERQNYDGDLPKLFKRVGKNLNLDPGAKDLTENLRQILGGLSSMVTGLAGLRNKMSDAHARTYKPLAHHARLAANSASTLVDFLFETFNYQNSNGTLKQSGPVSPSQEN